MTKDIMKCGECGKMFDRSARKLKFPSVMDVRICDDCASPILEEFYDRQKYNT